MLQVRRLRWPLMAAWLGQQQHLDKKDRIINCCSKFNQGVRDAFLTPFLMVGYPGCGCLCEEAFGRRNNPMLFLLNKGLQPPLKGGKTPCSVEIATTLRAMTGRSEIQMFRNKQDRMCHN